MKRLIRQQNDVLTVSGPSRGLGSFLQIIANIPPDGNIPFLAPLKVWVKSYTQEAQMVDMNNLPVFDPSQGTGGLLHLGMTSIGKCLTGFRPLSRLGWVTTQKWVKVASHSNNCFRPLSRVGWNPTREHIDVVHKVLKKFPPPIEAWVSSYTMVKINFQTMSLRFRPLARYAWFPTVTKCCKEMLSVSCFRPLSRYGWFPTLYTQCLRNLILSFRPLSRFGWFPT